LRQNGEKSAVEMKLENSLESTNQRRYCLGKPHHRRAKQNSAQVYRRVPLVETHSTPHAEPCTCGLTNDAPSIYGRGCTDIEQFL
jgi:hypothetical protein